MPVGHLNGYPVQPGGKRRVFPVSRQPVERLHKRIPRYDFRLSHGIRGGGSRIVQDRQRQLEDRALVCPDQRLDGIFIAG
jgi:hypothetical protein